ncbi:ABC transporter substrate-binding protein [Aeromicrobium senzhongii]|uniref:ABC transporter substrate-binding protein n=1 Tax=Aeromicrobium senzhongii TaxID=2663859 RepID=A0ABX6SUW9_9ACTN|nr:extracellular solute-binding protein [Aeromicrobium senzhongii]QNL95062.1 ABC transporter substrate-binding protein [Aeromicrobium senzhongii]
MVHVTRRTKFIRRSVGLAAAATLVGALASCGSGDDGGTPVINLFGGASATGFDKIIDECNKEADGAYRIVGNLVPSDADGQREQLVRRLAAKDKGMDLLGMDVVWTAEFAEAGWIVPLNEEQTAQVTEGTLEVPLETATWKDKVYGIPKHTNAQLMWYRKSLVDKVGDGPPDTWDEMFDMAEKLKAEGDPYEIGFTGARYEGLVVGFNTILSSYGGTIVNEDSTKVTIDDKTTEALALLKRLATSGLASRSLSNSQEPEVFAQLQNENSAFSLNWPYVLAAMREANKDVAQDLGFATFPSTIAGEPSRVTVGGMNFGISEYSEHKQESYDAAMCLRSPKHQLQHALSAGEPPTLEAVFNEAEFKEAYPQAQVLLDALETASSRPISPVYQNISTIISSTLSPPSAIDPKKTTEELKTSIQDAIDGKGILP